MNSPLAVQRIPNNWNEIIGQPTAVNLLKRLIETDNIPYSMLITGPTGVGKTSLVSLFVRTLLCLNRQPGSSEPCGHCEMCLLDPRTTVQENNITWIQVGQDETINSQIKSITDIVYSSPYGLGTGVDRQVIVIDELQSIPLNLLSSLLFFPELKDVVGRNRVTFIFISMSYETIETKNAELAQALRDRSTHISLRGQTTDDLIRVILGIHSDIEPEAAYLIAAKSHGSIRGATQLLETCLTLETTSTLRTITVVSVCNIVDWNVRKLIWNLIYELSKEQDYVSAHALYSELSRLWTQLSSLTSDVGIVRQLADDLDDMVLRKIIRYDNNYLTATNSIYTYLNNPLSMNSLTVLRLILFSKLTFLSSPEYNRFDGINSSIVTLTKALT